MTQMEKLLTGDIRPGTLIEKINELVDAYNSLEKTQQDSMDDFENHMHHSAELQFGTGGPVIMSSTE
jgi:hypothetical protein